MCLSRRTLLLRQFANRRCMRLYRLGERKTMSGQSGEVLLHNPLHRLHSRTQTRSIACNKLLPISRVHQEMYRCHSFGYLLTFSLPSPLQIRIRQKQIVVNTNSGKDTPQETTNTLFCKKPPLPSLPSSFLQSTSHQVKPSSILKCFLNPVFPIPIQTISYSVLVSVIIWENLLLPYRIQLVPKLFPNLKKNA